MPRFARLIFSLLLCFALPAGAQVAADLIASPTDGLQQPAASFAVTEGAEAAVVNPAGISLDGMALRYLHQEGIRRSDFGHGNGDGVYLGGRLIGPLGGAFAVEWLRDRPGLGDSRRTTWALSLGGETFSLGGGLRLFSADLEALDDIVSVDVGAIARPARWLSLGFTVLDVDASQFAGARLPRRYIGAIGLRPLGDWLTLAVDGAVFGGEAPASESGFDDMRLAYTARAEVLQGLTLLGALSHRVDGDGPVAAQLGLALDFASLGLEATPLLQSGSGSGEPGSLFAAELRRRNRPGLELRRTGRVAVVDLDDAMGRGSGFQLFPTTQRDAMVEAIEGLHRLAADGSVDALVIKIRSLPDIGQGAAWEIRRALLDFRKSGKPLVALLEGGDDTEYYIASAADRIFATPEASFFVNGFSSRVDFFADTLALVGIEAEAVKIGAYKNAPDQLTRSEITPAHAEVVESILDDLFGRYVEEVSAGRRIDPARFREALATGIQSGRLAEELGLVDGLLYPDELDQKMADILGGGASLQSTTLRPKEWSSWSAAPVIAVIPIEGTITGGRTGGDFGFVETTGAETVIDALKNAAADPRVRAIVLRIDSGGGDAGGSQRIWRAVIEASKTKPVVASMGDAAASGGYYAAVGAGRIFASPSTITGSIGIFWLKPSIEGLLGFLEVHSYGSVRGELAEINTIRREWSPEARAALERYIADAYRSFIEAVAAGRSLTVEEVDALAQGRVWTGAQASERKLVDDLGGLSGALRYARSEGGLAQETAVEYRVYRPSAALVTLGPGASISLETPRLQLPAPLEALVRERVPPLLLLPNESGLWALAPFRLEVR